MAYMMMTTRQAYDMAASQGEMSDEDLHCFQRMNYRLLEVDTEQQRIRDLADRYDNLYYPNGFTAGGASHWADHVSATTPGRAHVSVNAYPSYVDIPASLTSVPPVENFVAGGYVEENYEEGQELSEDDESNKMERDIAAMAERLYTTWKDTDDIDFKTHKGCIIKGIYGRTAGKVYWLDGDKRPTLVMVEQPRNLRLGWVSSDFTKLSWACYTYLITPDEATETYGLPIDVFEDKTTGMRYPYVLSADTLSTRTWLQTPSEMRLEVYDYWYRQPVEGAEYERGEEVEFETVNAIFIGNCLIKKKVHPEYGGKMPYVPLYNTLIPGVPEGRSEFYDIEQLVREKDERFSEAAQMMSRAINGQYWQLIGPEAPETVPPSLRPIPNQVVGPGGGNRIEAISPWMPSFQVEQHLTRIDRELADVSGLSDLLRGLAPTAVLSSGKAISALIANYEARIRIKRELLYRWRKEVWALAADVWAHHEPDIRAILLAPYRHEITPPSLTPRDDMETATLTRTLVDGKLWSAKRGMDRTGVDDPEQEMDIIREEQTDATYNPAAMMTMAQLLTVLKQLNIPAPEEVQAASQAQQEALGSSRLLGGGAQGEQAMNGEGEQAMLGEEAGAPAPEEGQVPGQEMAGGGEMTAPEGGMEGQMLMQQQTGENGNPRTRILSQQKVIG